MNSIRIIAPTGIQSRFGMPACGHASFRATDLARGHVALKPATVTRKGWVRGTPAWRPPIV